MWIIEFREHVINLSNDSTFITLNYADSWEYEPQGSMFVDGGINCGSFLSTSTFSVHVWTREFLSRDDPNFNDGDREGTPIGTLDIRGAFGSFTAEMTYDNALEMSKKINDAFMMRSLNRNNAK